MSTGMIQALAASPYTYTTPTTAPKPATTRAKGTKASGESRVS